MAVSCFCLLIVKGQVPVLGIPKGHLAEVYSPDISANGKFIVTPSADKTAKVWEMQTGKLLFSLEAHTDQVLFAKFTKDNKDIVTAGDNRIITWDALTGKKKFQLVHGEVPPINFYKVVAQTISSSSITAMAISNDEKYLASGATDSSIIIWEIKTGKKIQLLKHTGKLRSIVFTTDNQHLISLTENYVVSYWDFKNAKFLKRIIPDAKNVAFLNVNADGKKILTLTDTDASACVWDFETGKMLHHFSTDSRLMSVSWSPDGKKIIGAAKDQSFVWDAITGKPVYQLAGHKGWVYNAIFSPDRKSVV